MIQLTKTATRLSGSAADLECLRKQFEQRHYIRLPQFVEIQLVRLFQHGIDHAKFYERVHKNGGTPPPIDHCMKDNSTTGFLYFLVNDSSLFKLIQQITGCAPIGCFCGAVYRLVPGLHYDSWHSDVNSKRMVAMSINLSRDLYSGGILQIREKNSLGILHEVANTGLGDAVIFRISPQLQHRVSKIEGAVARTAYAGWFQSEPNFLSQLKERAALPVVES